MSETRERIGELVAYLEASATSDVKGKWAKGYRQACVDHIALLRLALALEKDDA